ncbi:MAG TPA: hypothetical protein VIW24_13190 [Aldersonia sp.]
MQFQNGNLVLDRHRDLIFLPALAGDLVTEMKEIRQSTGFDWDQIIDGANEKDKFPQASLNQNTTIYVWAHGNRSKSAIAVGKVQMSPRAVLRGLAAAGMTPAYDGNVFFWSCFAGVFDGFAESFAMHCKTQGFVHLTVHATPFVTGEVKSSHFFVQDLASLKAQLVATADSSKDVETQALRARDEAIKEMRGNMQQDGDWAWRNTRLVNYALMGGFKRVRVQDIVSFDPATIVVRSAEAPGRMAREGNQG